MFVSESSTLGQRPLPIGVGVMLALFTIAYSLPAHAAAGPGLLCKRSSLSATGNHHIRNASHRMALVRWRDKAASIHGQAYSKWPRSLGRSLTCSHGVLAGRPNWRCVARGVPCRLRLPSSQHRPNVKSRKPGIKLRRKP